MLIWVLTPPDAPLRYTIKGATLRSILNPLINTEERTYGVLELRTHTTPAPPPRAHRITEKAAEWGRFC